MRTETITLYSFNELSERAQRRAWEDAPNFSSDYTQEYGETLAAFENIFDIKVYRWHVDENHYDFAYVITGTASGAPEGNPLRLARYMWNNYADYITEGRYYSKVIYRENERPRVTARRSKAQFSRENCPLTGFCADCDILQPVIDCLKYTYFFDSYAELIDECLNRFFTAWQAEIEWCSSIEHFAEICEANDYEFTETGEMW